MRRPQGPAGAVSCDRVGDASIREARKGRGRNAGALKRADERRGSNLRCGSNDSPDLHPCHQSAFALVKRERVDVWSVDLILKAENRENWCGAGGELVMRLSLSSVTPQEVCFWFHTSEGEH